MDGGFHVPRGTLKLNFATKTKLAKSTIESNSETQESTRQANKQKAKDVDYINIMRFFSSDGGICFDGMLQPVRSDVPFDAYGSFIDPA